MNRLYAQIDGKMIEVGQCEGITIDYETYAPNVVIDETYNFNPKQVPEITFNTEFDYSQLERTVMSSRTITSNIYQRTKPFKAGLKPLHWTFSTQPNGNGMNRAMYRTGMKWSEEYKETKRRVKHIALPHRIRRTVLHFLAKIKRSLRDNKGLLPS